ncbi:MAG: hypothetical protein LIO77_03320 [Rikenellaceae bacterium]|nr:hypothetical protein [Rikenellaceae bacterium]
MGRREELEKELDAARKRIEALPETTPQEVVKAWHREVDSISFELNNLYDDQSADENSREG